MSMTDLIHRRPRLPLAAVPPIDAPDDDPAADDAMEAEIGAEVGRNQAKASRKRDAADALRIRDECRSDAATVVARAIKRGGRDPMIVAPNDAAIIWIVSEFLQKVADQKVEADSAFAALQKPSDAENQAVERAMRPRGEAASPARAIQPAPAASPVTVDDKNIVPGL